MVETENIIEPENMIELIYEEGSDLHRNLLHSLFKKCSETGVNEHQMYPFVYAIGLKYFGDVIAIKSTNFRKIKQSLILYAIKIDEFDVGEGTINAMQMSIESILQMVFFDDLLTNMEMAYKICPALTVHVIIRAMDPGNAGKKQRELLVTANERCVSIIKYGPIYANIMQQHNMRLLESARFLLVYNKDFRSDIIYGSGGVKWTLEQGKIVNTPDEPIIVKLCRLINTLPSRELDDTLSDKDTVTWTKIKKGIEYIFYRNEWFENSLDENLYILAVYYEHELINRHCLELLAGLFKEKMSSTKSDICPDDFIDTCKCSELMLCRDAKVCPQSMDQIPAKYRTECRPFQSGGKR